MVGCSLLAIDPEVFGTYVVPSIFKVSLLKDEVKVEVEVEVTTQNEGESKGTSKGRSPGSSRWKMWML